MVMVMVLVAVAPLTRTPLPPPHRGIIALRVAPARVPMLERVVVVVGAIVRVSCNPNLLPRASGRRGDVDSGKTSHHITYIKPGKP